MKFYITTPIYYVNDMPHIGHAYTTVAADISARWHTLHGDDVFFLTGTDEHGAKICQAADEQGQNPRALCDQVAEQFKIAWDLLNIKYSRFIRTTDQMHEKTVQVFLEKLHKAGAIYKGNYEGLYCTPCEKYLLEADLVDGCCQYHKEKPTHHSEENYFFALKKYREQLIELIASGKMEILPSKRKNEILGKLRLGLEDISISRANLEWGIPLPFDKEQTAYVWVDALLNYISGVGYDDNPELFKKYWPANIQLMAKDILWFHTVIWPAMLLAAGVEPPSRIFSHGFFTLNGDKMSKTLGNTIQPHELVEKFGVDATRYLMVSLFPFGADGDISWNSLTHKYNTDLANNLGNLVARSLTMVYKFNNGLIPSLPDASHTSSSWTAHEVVPRFADIETHYENLNFYGITTSLQTIIDTVNTYIEDSAPWKMAKENNPELPYVLFNLIQSIGVIAIYLLPFMPNISKKIWLTIGETDDVETNAQHFLSTKKFTFPHPGREIKKSGILFPRFEVPR